MSGALSGSEDMKGSVERPARATLDHHHRHGQDRLGSVERGHKTGLSGNALACRSERKRFWRVLSRIVAEVTKSTTRSVGAGLLAQSLKRSNLLSVCFNKELIEPL